MNILNELSDFCKAKVERVDEENSNIVLNFYETDDYEEKQEARNKIKSKNYSYEMNFLDNNNKIVSTEKWDAKTKTETSIINENSYDIYIDSIVGLSLLSEHEQLEKEIETFIEKGENYNYLAKKNGEKMEILELNVDEILKYTPEKIEIENLPEVADFYKIVNTTSLTDFAENLKKGLLECINKENYTIKDNKIIYSDKKDPETAFKEILSLQKIYELPLECDLTFLADLAIEGNQNFQNFEISAVNNFGEFEISDGMFEAKNPQNLRIDNFNDVLNFSEFLKSNELENWNYKVIKDDIIVENRKNQIEVEAPLKKEYLESMNRFSEYYIKPIEYSTGEEELRIFNGEITIKNSCDIKRTKEFIENAAPFRRLNYNKEEFQNNSKINGNKNFSKER